jgi:hypothetical protein
MAGGDLRYAQSRVDAEVLVMPCAMDRPPGVEGALETAQGIDRSRLAIIDSQPGSLGLAGSRGVARDDLRYCPGQTIPRPAILQHRALDAFGLKRTNHGGWLKSVALD